MTDLRKDFEDITERNRQEAQRQRDEVQAWIDRNAERRHREAEERHWRRMEQQNRRNPIVTGLAAYGAYKAYEAFTSDDDQKEEIEALRKQNAKLQEKLRELMLKNRVGRGYPTQGLERCNIRQGSRRQQASRSEIQNSGFSSCSHVQRLYSPYMLYLEI